MRKSRIVFILILMLLFSSFAIADRLALVIGNGDYSGSPLRNPVNDAHDMAATLRSLDFEVMEKTNLNKRNLEEAAESFEDMIRSDDVALFYYSGHGLQVNGSNYLIPLEASIDEENDVRYEAVELDRILEKLAKAKLNIIILDACRDNPFRRMRSAGKGLAQIATNKVGTFIAYSTAPGSVASDGTGRNSPYTKHLIEQMQTGLKIEETFKEVRKSVISETRSKQVPWDASCLADDFYFCMSCAPMTTEPVITKPVAQKPVISGGSDYTSSMGIDMVYVEGGTFQMGSTSGKDNEKPVLSVTVSDFYIGKYEVTQGEYEAVMDWNPSKFKQSGKDAPVEQFSWYDAVEYCNKLSDKEDKQKCYSDSGNDIKCNFNANGYRLLTEAEWEFAAKGGNKGNGYKYAGSNTITEVTEYEGNNDESTKPVGGKQANELGVYDMSGNVWEWCWDWYGDYSSDSQDNPRGSLLGSNRMRRGGSWNISASSCRTAYRGSNSPGFCSYSFGFRIACSLK